MDKLKFYNVPNDYIEYLQEAELSVREFSRVPNLDYGTNRHSKFVCGVVLKVNDTNYFVPVTSYKNQKPDNFLIKDKKNNIVSSLRFNYMFPVPMEIVEIKDLKNETNLKYRNLLEIELRYCQKNQSEILKLAKRTHHRVMIGKNPGLIHNSCDFKLLEQKCKEYSLNQAHQQQPNTQTSKPILPNEISNIGSQGFGGLS